MTGLIGWWPLHDNSGQANDLSGNNNNGTLNAGITQGVAGKGGLNSYSFDGSDDWIRINHSSELSGMNELTLSFWMYVESGQNSYATPLMKNDFSVNNPTRTYGLMFTGGGEKSALRFQLDTSNTSSHQIVETSISNWSQQWYHITATYDGSRQKIYVNGVEENSKALTGTVRDDSYDLGIARQDGNSNQHFKGRMSDVRVYNRALTPQEIQTLYEWGSGDYTDKTYHDGSDSGAVSRWKFDGDVTDSWGGNDGSNNGVSFVSDAVRGKAASFEPSNSDYIAVGNASNIFDLSSGTISWWGYVNSSFSGIDKFFEHFSSGSNDRIYADYRDSNNGDNFTFALGDTGVSTSVRPTDAWIFWTATWDGSKVKIYRNGAKTTISSYSYGSIGDEKFDIGRRNGNNDQYLDGRIDDVRVYSGPLKPCEVFQLYQWGTRGRDMRKLTLNARGG